jgi:hypothetical protein
MSEITYLVRSFPPVTIEIQPPGLPAPDPNVTGQRTKRIATVKVKERHSRSWRVTLGAPTFEVRTAAGLTVAADVLWCPVLAGRDYDTLRAIIRWGDESGTHEAVIDWAQGYCFAVHAHYVEVDAVVPINATSSAAAAVGQTRRLLLKANISPDTGGEEIKHPTFTTRTGLITSGDASAVIPIPPYARRVRWSEVSSALTPVGLITPATPLVWFQAQDATLSRIEAQEVFTSWASGQIDLAGAVVATTIGGWPNDGGWAIFASSRYLRINNAGGTDPPYDIELALEFDLDLG